MVLADDIIGVGQLRDRVKIYYDWLTRYVCDANVGSLLTENKWKITKIQRTPKSSENVTVANGGEYNNRATDLTTVKLYTYS